MREALAEFVSTRYYSSKLEFYLAVSLVPLCSCIAVATLLLSHSCFCSPLPSSLFILRPRCTYIRALSILFRLCSFSRFAPFVLLSLPSFSFTMRAFVLSKLFLFSLFHVRTVRRIAGLARALPLYLSLYPPLDSFLTLQPPSLPPSTLLPRDSRIGSRSAFSSPCV